jgi:formamidopyrimidine-DNA glycosylase
MPELPEVETIVRCLQGPLARRRLVHAHLRRAALYRAKSLSVRWLVGRSVSGVTRVGKNLAIHFDPAGVMVINLGMTGRIGLSSRRAPTARGERKHLHGRFGFDGDLEVRYYDVRRFGRVFVTESRDVARVLGLGPDPFEASARYLSRMLRGRTAPIKSLLLDQRILSGVGNIYADESLYEARVDPRTSGDRAAARAAKILSSVRIVLKRAIARRGSTIRDYRQPDGSEGDFQRFHAVYGRGGKPCPRCGTLIERIVLSGRGTHFCPSCQA